MREETKISVGVITYNQQDTIRQTLDSILSQKGDFELEIVIGEDCSTDNTRAICEEYVSKCQMTNHQSQIVLLPLQKNLGIVGNFARVMKACTGEFFSCIAGDDYYCDDHALEKQMLYLQSHPDVGVMGAQGYRYYVRRGIKEPNLNPVVSQETEKAKEYYFSPNRISGIYFQPIGLMIRRKLLRYIDFSEFIKRKFSVEDYPMQAIWSQYTHFACMPDLLVTYRIYGGSATFTSFNSPRYMDYHRGLVAIRRYLNELFPQDACVSEFQLQEYIFYREFLLYVYQYNFKKAKQLIADAPILIKNSKKFQRAKRFSKTRLLFYIFHFYKKFAKSKEMHHRT